MIIILLILFMQKTQVLVIVYAFTQMKHTKEI